MKIKLWLYAIVSGLLMLSGACTSKKIPYTTWEVYGGNKEANHYSALNQIDTTNVNNLSIAWVYHTGDADSTTQIQVNPIIIGNMLYGVSPKLKLFALDAATGKMRWVFDPAAGIQTRKGAGYFQLNVCRGVTYYSNGRNEKFVFYSAGSRLYCVDATNGHPVSAFGDSGSIDLHHDLGRDVNDLYVASTSPGIIYRDLIIIGTRVAEEADAAPGYIRAYNVHTGNVEWVFHTIPQPGEYGYNSWEDKNAWEHIGGANAWAGFSLDEKKGILFAPIGSASYDFYGGKRKGNDLFANCVLALDAATGKRIWNFQTVHHDLWDRDLPAAPVLVTVEKNGKKIAAVAQITKSGFIFLLDRESGKPLYPVREIPVPQGSELTGEKLSPTQPIPDFPVPFTRQLLQNGDLNNLVPDSSRKIIQRELERFHTGNMFNPPSKEGTVIFPGFDGGGEWGGPSYDPGTDLLYVNGSEMPWILTMVPVAEKKYTQESNLEAGKRLYLANCMSCHGTKLQGGGNYPALIDVNKKYNWLNFKQLINSGRRMMPAFRQLSDGEKDALASFILDIGSLQRKTFIPPPAATGDPYWKMPYTSTGYNKFLTPEGYPAVAPPWGFLKAVSLRTGQIVWQDTLGDYSEFKAKGIHTGTENYGGSVVTAGGLLFIAATSDHKIRAFNKRTGKLLWEKDLPTCGFATPAVYSVSGREFLVIACGGGKLKKKSGDAYVAFAL